MQRTEFRGDGEASALQYVRTHEELFHPLFAVPRSRADSGAQPDPRLHIVCGVFLESRMLREGLYELGLLLVMMAIMLLMVMRLTIVPISIV